VESLFAAFALVQQRNRPIQIKTFEV